MSAEQCAAEGLRALQANRATHIAGRVNRLMARFMPRAVATTMMGKMIGKVSAAKALVEEAALDKSTSPSSPAPIAKTTGLSPDASRSSL